MSRADQMGPNPFVYVGISATVAFAVLLLITVYPSNTLPTPPPQGAQVEIDCPLGYEPISALQTYNGTTGKIRRYGCVGRDGGLYLVMDRLGVGTDATALPAGYTAPTSGATINTTNNVLPKRSSATAFADSSLTDDGTVVTGTEPIRLGYGTNAAPSYSFSASTGTGIWGAAGNIYFSEGSFATNVLGINNTGIQASRASSGIGFGWTTGAPSSSSMDTQFQSSAAGTVLLGNGTIGDTSGTLQAATFIPVVNCANVTPVTVSTSTTADQNLQACSLSAGALNRTGRTLRLWAAGVYSTPAASTATVNIKAKLCTVSGCGSGTVINLSSITSAMNPGTVTNNSINLQLFTTTQTSGASAAFESHGNLVIDLSASPGLADSTFSDSNAATVGTIDSTAALFLQVTGAFSAASASNSLTLRQLIVQSQN